jgi:hypothetical protein
LFVFNDLIPFSFRRESRAPFPTADKAGCGRRQRGPSFRSEKQYKLFRRFVKKMSIFLDGRPGLSTGRCSPPSWPADAMLQMR